jgi:glucosamine--fructose-6-phosphate aminotransferase (isomerizing)
LAFYGLAMAFAARRGARPAAEIKALADELRSLPQQLRQLVDLHDQRSEALAHRFADTQDVIFLGRGINYPIALEGALKAQGDQLHPCRGLPGR